MLALLSKFLPFLGPLLERVFPDKGKAAELKAEKELVEARAFSKGRISPRYLLKYVLVALFALFGLGTLAHAFFPAAFPLSPMRELQELLKTGAELLRAADIGM